MSGPLALVPASLSRLRLRETLAAKVREPESPWNCPTEHRHRHHNRRRRHRRRRHSVHAHYLHRQHRARRSAIEIQIEAMVTPGPC